MDLSKKLLTWLIFLLIIFGWCGFVYECSYFQALDENAVSFLSLRHYILSGFYQVGVLVLILMIISHFSKFFSKDIDKDDWDLINKRLENTELNNEIWSARLAFIISIIYWVASTFDTYVFSEPKIYVNYLFIIFIVSSFFLIPLLKANKSSISTLLIFYVISISFVFSAGAIGQAKSALMNNLNKGLIRNDSIVYIELDQNGKKNILAKPIKFPKIIENVISNFEY